MIKFSSDLILWYKENKRVLPWRNTIDPYCIWVSEIILQQTRVNQGLNYYNKFIEVFPSIYHLAKASEDTVLFYWQGLGYYSRARNMHSTAKFIVSELDGVFPNSYSELLKLKGVGTYTAAAISSICFNEHKSVVDGNVFRVLTRLFGIETPINTSKGKREIEVLAHKLNNSDQSGIFNQALMEFGALQCVPKLMDCSSCIFNSKCYAHINSLVYFFPQKVNKTKVQNRYMNFMFLKDSFDNVIVQRRESKDIWKGLYQFPLIESSTSISIKELMLRDDFVRLFGGGQVQIKSEVGLKHLLSHRKLYIKIVYISVKSFSEVKVLDGLVLKINELSKYAFPKPLENYIKGLNSGSLID